MDGGRGRAIKLRFMCGRRGSAAAFWGRNGRFAAARDTLKLESGCGSTPVDGRGRAGRKGALLRPGGADGDRVQAGLLAGWAPDFAGCEIIVRKS